jgi:hypothetical protein
MEACTMSSKQLLILPRGTDLSPKDRERLTRAGFITIEMERPSSARLIGAAGAEIGGSQVALAAARAITEAPYDSKSSVMILFSKLICEAMKAECSARDAEHL